jgi:hypothetical protein
MAVVALFAACGGGEVSSDEVPGDPPALTVPSDDDIGSGGSADNASADADDTTGGTDDPEATATPDSTTGDAGTVTPPATDDTSGGTTVPETAPEDSATTDTPPPAGSDAEQFEDFCEQNAGAC